MSDCFASHCQLTAAEVVDRLEALVGQPGVSETYVRWRIALLQAQAAAREALSMTPNRTTAPAKPPLPLRPEQVDFPPHVTEGLLRQVLTASRRFGRSNTQLRRLEAGVAAQPALLDAQTLRACWIGDDRALLARAEQLGAAVELLEFVGRVIVAPHVTHALASWPPKGTLGRPSTGRCPACDSLPGLAGIERETSFRVLFCSLCGRPWRFPRLRCPFCAAENPEGLQLLRVESQPARWLEACTLCRHYLRTVDLRQAAEPVVLVAEDVLGLYLDVLAEQDGYRPGPFLAAMQ